MTSETKNFPTLDVLTAITGRMVINNIGPVYEVCNWAAGEPVFTHQLPRVGRELQAAMAAAQPGLDAAIAEAEQVSPETWRAFAALWLDRYGPTLAVPKLTEDQHERIDPVSELAERTHLGNIIVVRA